MRFEDLRLAEPILRAARAEGYTTATPIQVKAIPHVLEGRDVLGCAQTGTGKTAAFAMPMLHRLSQSRPHGRRRGIRALILAPTRELAAQIGESFRTYGRHTPLRYAVIFGGVNQNPQARALREGIDILVATPGRLLDLMEQGLVNLTAIEVLVLDEADRMLDMGFIRDIRKIVAQVPTQRQTLMFSATMPADIRELAAAILRRPVNVHVPAASLAADTVEQSVYFVEKRNKPAMLEYFLNHNAVGRAIVFTRTKHGADRVARHLSRAGIRSEAIHGNKSQNARTRAIDKFKSGAPPVLVATDIAARGLDIQDVSHVINFDLPNVPEDYVHRIGRTGRAGAAGRAVSFCDGEERSYLQAIERLIARPIPAKADGPHFPATGSVQNAAPRQQTRTNAPQQPKSHRRGENLRCASTATSPQHRQHRVAALPDLPLVAAAEQLRSEAPIRPAKPAGVGHRVRRPRRLGRRNVRGRR